ncbi:Endo-1,4-beta-glucanase [Chitinispirillum alkaliphilum]|nr:Endo-1,4-beta-glucanase [Chitinispirillum alkaliphilum]
MLIKLIASAFFIFSVSTLRVSADPFVQNQKLGRGINMGNMFDAPSEGEWDVSFKDHYFDSIAQKGFQSVRVPIRWSAPQRTQLTEPYTISDDFFARIDHVIEKALNSGLSIIINVHHYEELFRDATGFHRDRFIAIWQQISEHYSEYSDSLYFEVLNEPYGDLTPDRWNTLFAEVLQIIRSNNPTRTVLIGTAEWGGIEGLRHLEIPNDPNLILTVHYYSPFEFTHQNAFWLTGMEQYKGTTWDGTFIQKNDIINHMERIRSFAQKHNIPVNIGEFGAYGEADSTSRYLYSSFVSRLFERYDFSWHYWEFCAYFGAYDPYQEKWVDTIVNALISSDTSILYIDDFAPKGNNLITNGGFDSDLQDWTFGTWDQSGQASSEVINGELTINIERKPQESWQVQLIQNGIQLQQNTEYIVMFDARSKVPVSIHADVSASGEPWTTFGSSDGLILSEKMRTYAFEFTVTQSHSNARLVFNLGTDPTTIHFDNIRIIELSDDRTNIQSRPKKTPSMFGSKIDKLPQGLHLDFVSSKAQNATVALFNANGRMIASKTIHTTAGQNSIQFPQHINPGPIFIRFQTEEGSHVERFMNVK